jgi:hypothetical protein
MSREDIKGVGHVQTPARVLDLSARGALLSLRGAMEVGEIHDFILDIGGDGLWVQGEVRRCRTTGGGAFEVGIEFIGIAPSDERRLQEYLGRRVS